MNTVAAFRPRPADSTEEVSALRAVTLCRAVGAKAHILAARGALPLGLGEWAAMEITEALRALDAGEPMERPGQMLRIVFGAMMAAGAVHGGDA